MRRQDYKTLADALHSCQPSRHEPAALGIWAHFVTAIREVLKKKHGDKFDEVRFVRRCERGGDE